MKRLLALLAAALVFATCSGLPGDRPPSPLGDRSLSLVITSDSYHTARLDIWCGGHRLKMIRGIEMNRSYSREVDLRGCDAIVLNISLVAAHDSYVTAPITVHNRECLAVRIGAQPVFTSWVPCRRA